MMKVLLVASEANPFIKTGGLGDVVGALPKALSKKGVDVRVVIPKYKGIREDLKNKFSFVKWFMVKVGWRNQYCGIFECAHNGVKYYFIDNEYYFGRDEIYGCYDDGERFAYYDRAVLEFIKEIGWIPDIIHCNDWQTGMIPVLLKLEYSKDELYKNIKTIYSIHNILFQGIFPKEVLPDLFGYDMEAYNNGSLEFYECISFMKGGINYSDKVTTVSYSYAEEIKTPEYGEKLDGLLREHNYNLKGILNGIDYDLNNPATDNTIFVNFDVNCIEKKLENKKKLQEILGLEVNPDIPLVGIVSRLTSQKGLDLINYMMPEIMSENLQMVVLGTGEHQYQSMFNYYNSNFSDKLSARITFDTAFAQQIYAACDIFLMPSLYEPCGIGQMLAMRYGSIPIVRETGGLKDTVMPYNKFTGEGNGFSFANYNAHEMFFTLQKAIKLYQDKNIWNNLIINAMNTDNSWKKSAQDYIRIFKSLIS